MFSTRSPGPPSASHSIPPSSCTVRSKPFGTSRGATGTGRTIGHPHRWSSNDIHPALPGCLGNLPGQGIAGFPTVDIEFRRPSARRSECRRSRSWDPKSTCDMASANKPVAGLVGDEAVHLVGHPAVARMTLRTGAELDEVHRLAGVHLHGVPDPVGQGDGVGRLHRERRRQRLGQLPRPLQRRHVPFLQARPRPPRRERRSPSRRRDVCHSMVSIRCRCRSRKAP